MDFSVIKFKIFNKSASEELIQGRVLLAVIMSHFFSSWRMPSVHYDVKVYSPVCVPLTGLQSGWKETPTYQMKRSLCTIMTLFRSPLLMMERKTKLTLDLAHYDV